MKYALKILPKPEVLDTQGRAVRDSFKNKGMAVKDCHVGRYIVLEVEGGHQQEAENLVKQMAESGLCNPLIEDYQVEAL